MKIINTVISTLLLSVSFSGQAQDSAQHGSQASKHSALATSHATVSVAKTASTVVAVPLIAAGTVGSAAKGVGESLLDSAAGAKKLQVTDKVITADPSPAIVMKASADGEDQ